MSKELPEWWIYEQVHSDMSLTLRKAHAYIPSEKYKGCFKRLCWGDGFHPKFRLHAEPGYLKCAHCEKKAMTVY
jgi:hypothetical protein